MSSWPKHQDGSPKKMGEMTPEEREACWTQAAQKVKAELERPEVQARLAAVLNGTSTRKQ